MPDKSSSATSRSERSSDRWDALGNPVADRVVLLAPLDGGLGCIESVRAGRQIRRGERGITVMGQPEEQPAMSAGAHDRPQAGKTGALTTLAGRVVECRHRPLVVASK
jgi:hypothetical protein